ncbi:MAG: hypothetical protein H7318_07210 [Oligoflexus sp.]|nr:hypothetical protein [Oligoflexus sp.]
MKPIAIFYEHADWFKPLFAELDARDIPYVKIDAASHAFPLDQEESPYSLSNFVADAKNVIGFDPFAKLVDYLAWKAKENS